MLDSALITVSTFATVASLARFIASCTAAVPCVSTSVAASDKIFADGRKEGLPVGSVGGCGYIGEKGDRIR